MSLLLTVSSSGAKSSTLVPWGTRAVGDDYGLPVNVMVSEGVYTLQELDNPTFHYGDDY